MHPALDVDERQRASVHGEDDETWCAVCGYRAYRVLHCGGVFLNLVVPSEAFNIALDLSALGIIASWATIVICQIQLYRWSKKGILERPSFRLFGTPYTSYATLIFLKDAREANTTPKAE
jgi:L-asparagine transporter-like permease